MIKIQPKKAETLHIEVEWYSSAQLIESGVPYTMIVECPKCHNPNAHYHSDYRDVFLTCICGYFKVVATKLETIITEHIDASDSVILPRKQTKLLDVLMAVATEPRLTTKDVTDILNHGRKEKYTTSDIASQLTILRYKGLVVVLVSRKGVAGGSVWTLTLKAQTLLGV